MIDQKELAQKEFAGRFRVILGEILRLRQEAAACRAAVPGGTEQLWTSSDEVIRYQTALLALDEEAQALGALIRAYRREYNR